MPDWMQTSLVADAELSWLTLLIRMAAATVFGSVVAGIYRVTGQRGSERSGSLVPTLVLLTIIIAMVTLAIGNSVARAFSLVGALSIVRFRTVVEDTRDTAFVIFAVAVGLALGAGMVMVPLLGMPFVAVAAFLFRRRLKTADPASATETLTVRLAIGPHPDAVLKAAFERHLESVTLKAAETAKQGASLDLVYSVRRKPAIDTVALVTELNALPGVQGIELRCD